MNSLIERNLEAIVSLGREFGVARLELFGSAATDAFDPDRSDVDFIVASPPGYDFGPWLARFQVLEASLTAVLGREVNLVMTSALANRWFAREAARTRTVIYDALQIPEVRSGLTMFCGRAGLLKRMLPGRRSTRTCPIARRGKLWSETWRSSAKRWLTFARPTVCTDRCMGLVNGTILVCVKCVVDSYYRHLVEYLANGTLIVGLVLRTSRSVEGAPNEAVTRGLNTEVAGTPQMTACETDLPCGFRHSDHGRSLAGV